MVDQANRLRNIVKERHDEKDEHAFSAFRHVISRVITVTSGKGGVGKTNLAINLGIQLSKLGKRIIIIDADFGLANIEVLAGILPKYNLTHVLNGSKTVDEILTDGPMGIRFLSGGSGLKELANISERQMSNIIDKLSILDGMSDIILIDTGAGISSSVTNFIRASNETLIITTPEPTSITDAYAIIKSITEDKAYTPEFKVVINKADDDDEGLEVFNKLNMVSEKFLGLALYNLGYIPYDENLIKAVKKQEPVSICFPESPVVRAIDNIGRRLIDYPVISEPQTGGIKGFMKRFRNLLR